MDPRTVAYRRTFSVCLFTVNIWAYIRAFEQVPSWLLNHNILELGSRFAYVTAFALLESVALFILIIMISFALPDRFFRHHLAAQSTVVLVFLAAWTIYWKSGIYRWRRYLPYIVVATILFVIAALLFSWWLSRFDRIMQALDAFTQRIEILSALYLILGVSALIVILVRVLL